VVELKKLDTKDTEKRRKIVAKLETEKAAKTEQINTKIYFTDS